jgi:hypothetical protein
MDWYSYGQEATRRVAEVARKTERRRALGLTRRGLAETASESTPVVMVLRRLRGAQREAELAEDAA